MATSCQLMRIFCKEKKTDTNLVSVPIDDARSPGPILWETLFIIANGYPDSVDDEKRSNAAKWLDSLGDVLPVQSYRCSYSTHKDNYDLNDVASSKKNMVDYFVGLQNSVAEKLDHMSPITSDEVIKRYSRRLVDSSKKVHNSCVF